jgi:hypothetical protein
MLRRSAVVLLFLAAGCSDADVEKLRRVGDKTYERMTVVAQNVADELGQTLLNQKIVTPGTSPPEQQDAAQKVRQRLAWDREFAELPFVVTLEKDTLTLKGTVKSDAQKLRAVELAERTVGVAKVIADIDVAEAEKPEAHRSN